MIAIRKRGRIFHADLLNGKIHLARGSLGKTTQDAARRIADKLEKALAEGATSLLWQELRSDLPQMTFLRFASLVGAQDTEPATWQQLRKSFQTFAELRIKMGKLSASTLDRYEYTYREFDKFLAAKKITLLSGITMQVVDDFKMSRIESITKKKRSRGGTSIILEAAILHRIFSFALSRELIPKNPVQLEGRPGEHPEGGAEPFSPEELSALRDHAGDDLLCYLLLRRTGFRGSDAVELSFKEIKFDRKEIERITRKRKKKVILPIHNELLFALEVERDKRKPQERDRVLLNPRTGKPMTRHRLYDRVVALGRRAGVANVHPHRFRDTFAVDLLLRGANPYDVAKMLGDTIQTVEEHYAPYVPELRERSRSLMHAGVGMEELSNYSRANHPSTDTTKN